MSDHHIGSEATSMSEVELDLTAEDWAEPSDDPSRSRHVRHRRFFFEDGNLYMIIGDVLYNLHRSVLSPQDPTTHWAGRSEQYPLRLQDITPHDFDMLLSLVYPSVNTVDDVLPGPRSAGDWISILDQCQRWRCQRIRSIAVEQLKLVPMDDVLKIAVWRKYGLDQSQLISSYQALCTRDLPLTVTEGRMLEVDTAVKVSALREKVLQGVMSHIKHPTAAGNGVLALDRAKELICRAFLMDFMTD